MSLILVTGGAGFIGSHLVKALLERGYRVRVLDNFVSGRRERIDPRAELIEGDICDAEACRRAAAGAAGAFHLAAMSRVAASLEDAEGCTRSNVLGTETLLRVAQAAGLRKVVYSGSSTYYGSRRTPHFEYETPPEILNLYGLTKHIGEQYCLAFDRLYGLPTIVLRYFNVYGPHQPETGAYALVLGIFLRRWAEGQPLVIHGGGSQRRDFVHVHDVVRASILAYESERRGEVFNVGSGVSVSIKELADMISPNQSHEPRRTGDADETRADIARIRAALGWTPRTSLAEGLTELKRDFEVRRTAGRAS